MVLATICSFFHCKLNQFFRKHRKNKFLSKKFDKYPILKGLRPHVQIVNFKESTAIEKSNDNQ